MLCCSCYCLPTVLTVTVTVLAYCSCCCLTRNLIVRRVLCWVLFPLDTGFDPMTDMPNHAPRIFYKHLHYDFTCRMVGGRRGVSSEFYQGEYLKPVAKLGEASTRRRDWPLGWWFFNSFFSRTYTGCCSLDAFLDADYDELLLDQHLSQHRVQVGCIAFTGVVFGVGGAGNSVQVWLRMKLVLSPVT